MLLRDLFHDHATDAQLAALPMAPHARSALRLMARCGTGDLGWHTRACADCGHREAYPNCCRHHSCPFCSNARRLEWSDTRADEMLPCSYFHVVFTVPKELRILFEQDPAAAGNALFQAVRATIADITSNPAHLGATPALCASYHSWEQRMGTHPHIHVLCSAGGLNAAHEWAPARWNKKKKEAFLAPWRCVLACFKKHLFSALEHAAKQTTWMESHATTGAWITWLKRGVARCTRMYCKPTIRNRDALIRYLARYVARVAIAPSRIVAYNGKEVTFSARAHDTKNTQEHVTLSAEEFLRRYAQHIPPSGLRRHRHWGLTAPCHKKVKLAAARQALTGSSMTPPATSHNTQRVSCAPRCPQCGGEMITILESHRRLRELEGPRAPKNEPDYFADGIIVPQCSSPPILLEAAS